jgi:hypothetical protein
MPLPLSQETTESQKGNSGTVRAEEILYTEPEVHNSCQNNSITL